MNQINCLSDLIVSITLPKSFNRPEIHFACARKLVVRSKIMITLRLIWSKETIETSKHSRYKWNINLRKKIQPVNYFTCFTSQSFLSYWRGLIYFSMLLISIRIRKSTSNCSLFINTFPSITTWRKNLVLALLKLYFFNFFIILKCYTVCFLFLLFIQLDWEARK